MMRMPDNGRRRQQRYLWVALLLALPLFTPSPAQAGVFKCVAENGEITFSQTPCPKVKTEASAEEDASDGEAPLEERADDSDSNKKAAEPTEIALAGNAAQATPPSPVDTPVQPEEKPENPALIAKKRMSDARDEENRLQCQDNIEFQINAINSQMRNSSHSSSLVDSLKKKRHTLEGRLNDC